MVYIDESGIKPNIIRDYGWAPKGEKVFGYRKGKRERNINIIATLFNERTIMAPFLYDGSMNTDLFNIYLEEFLLPVLKPGQIIIMDNASFHKSIETELLIEQSGCLLLFLPPYSPEFNPIEHTWASLKRYIKRFRHKFDSVIKTIEYIFYNIIGFYGVEI